MSKKNKRKKGNIEVDVNPTKIELEFDKLPDVYTYEEVKQLNQATLESFVLGFIGNDPIAVIGIDSDIAQSNLIVQKGDKVVDFIKLDKSLADDIEFNVYPTQRPLSKDRILRGVYELILRKREERAIMEKVRNKKKQKSKSM